jgi:hypothetical protein
VLKSESLELSHEPQEVRNGTKGEWLILKKDMKYAEGRGTDLSNKILQITRRTFEYKLA